MDEVSDDKSITLGEETFGVLHLSSVGIGTFSRTDVRGVLERWLPSFVVVMVAAVTAKTRENSENRSKHIGASLACESELLHLHALLGTLGRHELRRKKDS